MPGEPTWIVTTSATHPIAEVVRALTKAGFEVSSVLGEIGVVTGRCAKGKAAALCRLPGVANVAPDTPVDIGPPGSTRTW